MADEAQPPREVTAEIGQLLDGRYYITGLIGDGGMGSVYRAEHVTIRKPVALKLLHRQYADQPGFAERFEREALAAGRIDHPNCVGVTDFGKLESGTLYLVMELALGRTLSEVLEERGRLPVDRALHIARHALRALDHAHGAGIVHRDVKPDNIILVDHEGDRDFAKLLDFGIAKLIGEAAQETQSSQLTQVGTTVGTPKYMPPEQAFGKEVDGRSDLYSLSVVLYIMLTGRAPFDADDVIDLLMQHASRPPPSFAEVAPGAGIPAVVEQLVLKGLEKKVANRHASASEYLRALEAVLDELAAAHSRDGSPSPPAPAPPAASQLADRDDTGTGAAAAPSSGTAVIGSIQKTPAPGRAWTSPGPAGARAPTPMSTLSLPAYRVGRLWQRITPQQWAIGLGAVLLLIIIIATVSQSGTDTASTAPASAPDLGVGTFLEDTARKLGNQQPSELALKLRDLNRGGRYQEVVEASAARDLDGHALLERGHALYGLGREAEAITAYLRATEETAVLRTNAEVLSRAGELMDHQQPEVALAATELLARFASDGKARDKLIALAGESRALDIRKRARRLATSLGLRGDVNLVRSYALDLVQEKSCEDRRKALLALGDLGDPRAIPVVKKSRHRARGGVFGIGGRNTNRCLRDDAERIARELEAAAK